MANDDLVRVAVRLNSILEDTCLVIGGLAVSAWGHIRATEDIDLVCRLESADIKTRLSEQGISTQLRKGDLLEGDIPWVISGRLSGVPFQILPPVIPIEWDQAATIPLPDGSELTVVDLMDLIRLKLRAGGVRDLWDVAMLVQSHPEKENEIRQLAASQGTLDDLEKWLNDPRLGDRT